MKLKIVFKKFGLMLRFQNLPQNFGKPFINLGLRAQFSKCAKIFEYFQKI
jgi:hypothetical protein